VAIKKTTKKKTKRKVAGRSAKNKRMPGWIILLGGMLIGLIIAVFFYVNDWVPKPVQLNNKPVAQQSPNTNINEDKSVDLQIEPKNNFDFYETLQDMEVVIDEKELLQTESRSVPTNYIIQLGAFKKLTDAEALKAQVAFIGLITHIQSVDINQVLWHRVRLGPYTSGRKADVVKRNLENNGFNALVLKEKT
jgi:cell division protein FtsN